MKGWICFVLIRFFCLPTAQARALVHAPDSWGEVAVVWRQHQEDHRFQHRMSLRWSSCCGESLISVQLIVAFISMLAGRVVLGLLLPPRTPVLAAKPYWPTSLQGWHPAPLGGTLQNPSIVLCMSMFQLVDAFDWVGSCKPKWWQMDNTVQEGCFCSFLGGFGKLQVLFVC